MPYLSRSSLTPEPVAALHGIGTPRPSLQKACKRRKVHRAPRVHLNYVGSKDSQYSKKKIRLQAPRLRKAAVVGSALMLTEAKGGCPFSSYSELAYLSQHPLSYAFITEETNACASSTPFEASLPAPRLRRSWGSRICLHRGQREPSGVLTIPPNTHRLPALRPARNIELCVAVSPFGCCTMRETIASSNSSRTLFKVVSAASVADSCAPVHLHTLLRISMPLPVHSCK